MNFYDGSNVEDDFTARARIADCVGVFLQPQFFYYGQGDAGDEKGNPVDQINSDPLNYYAKLDVKDIETEVRTFLAFFVLKKFFI